MRPLLDLTSTKRTRLESTPDEYPRCAGEGQASEALTSAELGTGGLRLAVQRIELRDRLLV